MSKGITGLDGTQIARLVEVVVRDSEIVLAPSILSPLAAAGDVDVSVHQHLPGGDCRHHGGVPAHDLTDDHCGHPDHRRGSGAHADHR